VSPSRIAILPSALADQIAAGEVVERAASVVKELCENSIDAGAHRIEVDIEGGGRRSVRVADDGAGMTPEEARLALRRHATSKIRSADDLWNLATFGFRGEALPSIAAVSRMTVATKVPGSLVGFRLTIEGGVETEAREVGIPEGTQIEVRDLFFNTPARLKFQKTESTEAANVSEAVLRLALANPEIHFRLRAGGRMVLDLPVHKQLGERVRAAFARRGAGALHEARGEEGGHQVRAFLAAPEEASSTARSTFLFVGRRFVRDRLLLHALALGYGELLEKGRYPLAALFLDVPHADLDVNVHPQKLEVRFARAAEVYAAVRHVVGDGVSRAPWLAAARGAARVHTLPPAAFPGGAGIGARGTGARSTGASTGAVATSRAGEEGFGYRRSDLDQARPLPAPPLEERSAVEDGDPGSSGRRFRSLSYVGQMRRGDLVCEAVSGDLVLIDLRVAREAVALDSLRKAHRRGEIKPRRLLFPVPVEVGQGQAAAALAAWPTLETLGFELDGDALSQGRVLVRALPETLHHADPKPLLHEILDNFSKAKDIIHDESSARWLEGVMITMAQHSLPALEEPLDRGEALALLIALDTLAEPGHRPHLRPLFSRLLVPDRPT